MAKLSVLKGATSVLVPVFIQDSSSITGAGLTGLVFNTSSLVCYRARNDDGNAGGTSITLATATRGTWTSGGFVEKDATNMPGWYEFGIPNNALASGSRSVGIHFKGAANMAPLALEIELTGFDNQSVTDGGLSKLTSLTFTGANKVDASVRDWTGQTIPAPNVTGVPLIDAKYLLGTILSTPATAGIIEANVKNINNQATSASGTITFPSGTIASTTGAVGSVTGSVGSVVGNVGGNVVGSVGSVVAGVSLSASESQVIASGTLVSGNVNSCVLPSALGADELVKGSKIHFVSGAGAKQTRIVSSYVDSSKTVSFDSTLQVAVDNTTGFVLSYNRLPQLTTNLGVAIVDNVNTILDSRMTFLNASITSRMATFTLPTNFDLLAVDSNGKIKTQSNIAKNAALAKFQFVMRDATTNAPAPGKIVTVTRSIDNGTHGAGALSAITEIGFGTYSVDFAAADLNGNVIVLRATAGSCSDTFERIITTP